MAAAENEPIDPKVLERLRKATSRLEIQQALAGVDRVELAKAGIV